MDKTILSYFEYLRDTSRKLANSKNLYRSLIPHSRQRNNVCETSEEVLAQREIKRGSVEEPVFIYCLNAQKKDSSQRVYLGVGSIVGNIKKRVFGAIVNIPVKLPQDHFASGKLPFELDVAGASINYDLLSSVLPDYFSSEYDDTAQEILTLINDLEEKLQDCSDVKAVENAIRVFIALLNKANPNILLEDLDAKLGFDEVCDIRNKKSPINQKQHFFNHNRKYFFANQEPDILSAHQALSDFCSSIKQQSFDNQLLHEIFSSVFGLGEVEVRQGDAVDYVPIFQKHLPVQLSRNQMVAINNAFNSRISYVQGPPGTGKSHMIFAAAVASFLLNKKVLIVSQKKQALDVIEKRLLEFFGEESKPPFIYFNKEEKADLKNSLLKSCTELPDKKEVDLTTFRLGKEDVQIKQLRAALDKKVASYVAMLNAHEEFFKKIQVIERKKEHIFGSPLFRKYVSSDPVELKTDNEDFLSRIQKIESKYIEERYLTNCDLIIAERLEKKFNDYFETEVDVVALIKSGVAGNFFSSWFEFCRKMGQVREDASRLSRPDILAFMEEEINTLQAELEQKQWQHIRQHNYRKFYSSLLNRQVNNEVQKFAKMLYWNNEDKIHSRMSQVKYEHVLNVFPVWISEIRNIGEILPVVNEMFDLVIIDEASQVNLAEILPVLYRSKAVCVVGDHQQLGLNASGLSFSLNKKYDKLVWNKYFFSLMDYSRATERSLTLTQASILDLIRSHENSEGFNSILLDEHYRSLPALARFNSKEFYNNEIKILTESPEKMQANCFALVQVAGSKTGGANPVEAKEIIAVLKFLMGKKSYAIELNEFVPEVPSIGIVSPLREQVDLINELIEEEFSEEEILKYKIYCGTPEEIQGHEFDVSILSTAVDSSSRNNAHHANENRFNVATSRARFFTIIVFSDVENVSNYQKYIDYAQSREEGFGGGKELPESGVYSAIKRIADEVTVSTGKNLEILQQVTCCGQKNLPFVIKEVDGHKAIIINVLGSTIKKDSVIPYGEQLIARNRVLTKSGWKVINILCPHENLLKTAEIDAKSLKEMKSAILDFFQAEAP